MSDATWVRDEGLEQIVFSWLREDMEEERPEISITSLIYCLTKTYYRNHMLVIDQPERETMLFATGLALEKVLMSKHQLPLAGECEGIAYHLDHFDSADDAPRRLIEVKSTRISLSREPDEFSTGWQKQIRAYAYCMHVEEAYFVIIHLMGGYRPPFPELRAWHVYLPQQEIGDNWAWLLERKETYEQFIEAEEVPTPYQYNEGWECENCAYKVVCDARVAGGF